MKDGNTQEQVTTYTYDSSGRLGTVADATDTFTYGYLLESNLVETLTSPAHTVTNTHETSRNVLDTKKNEVGSTLVSGYDYTVNALGQRTDLSQTGTAFATARSIAWGYDSLGQATKADSSIPGLDRAYQYDMIGNRLKSADSLTLPANNNYTVNALNQYTAVDSNSPSYDDDGNATAYPLPAHLTANSTLVWDAENRLTGATVSGIATSYAYDSQSRRIATVTGATTTLTIYDGWNPITKYSGATLDEAYLWGMDLSGSMQGAGGVAGLLSVNDGNASYYPKYDGNGNVSEYLDSAGSVQAHYEYDPFGKTTVATGTKAQDFAHRFSTKPLDTETGLYYYGYRYYDPVTGRWPSRDPITEQGGVNLYGFVYNNPLSWIDILGLNPDFGVFDKLFPPRNDRERNQNCLSRSCHDEGPRGERGSVDDAMEGEDEIDCDTDCFYPKIKVIVWEGEDGGLDHAVGERKENEEGESDSNGPYRTGKYDSKLGGGATSSMMEGIRDPDKHFEDYMDALGKDSSKSKKRCFCVCPPEE